MSESPNEGRSAGLVLLTGATGYVGGRLLRLLQDQGRSVRCMARTPDYLRPRVAGGAEVVAGDALDADSLPAVMQGVTTAYYMIHSMGQGSGFAERDRLAAENFAQAASEAGVRRIIYLGGLGRTDDDLSAHLRSRQEVGAVLRGGSAEVVEFRASIVLGSGSLSFEMIRSLVEKLPIMITPRWVTVPAQPIAIDDLLGYLLAALDLPEGDHRIFEIGGADVCSYGDLMREVARQRGLRRRMIRVPVLTPWLSSLWLGLVTPLYARVGRKLIDSIRHATTVQDTSALETFAIRPMGVEEAIARALRNEDREFAETHWYDAMSSSGVRTKLGGTRLGTRVADVRVVEVGVGPEEAFAPIERIGGQTGWYYGTWLWQLRGMIDLMVGGVGMRRGRPVWEQLRPGDALDFWRVEQIEPNRRLRLRAEMLVPGRAWLEFEVAARNDGSEIRQTALFDPHGLAGRVYWYALYPLHQLVFSGMLRGIARAAEPDRPDRPRVTRGTGPR